MKSVTQLKKWRIFKKLEQLVSIMTSNPTEAEMIEKIRLMREFNMTLPVHDDSDVYSTAKDSWLDENFYQGRDVMEDENGEYVYEVNEVGEKRKIYLLDVIGE